MSEMIPLPPCPKCGHQPPWVEGDYAYGLSGRHPDPDNDANHTTWHVWCPNDECEVEVEGPTQAIARAEWERRALCIAAS